METQLSLIPELVPNRGRCRMCHRPLTDPQSIERGIGPVCAKKEAAMHEELSNLPPGVTEDMLPGNRPEDEEKTYEIYVYQGEVDRLKSFMVLQALCPPDKRHPLTDIVEGILIQIEEE